MKITMDIKAVFEHKQKRQKNSKLNLKNFSHHLSEPREKLGPLPKDESKQRRNFGRLNQSQNKLGLLIFRMVSAEDPNMGQGDTFRTRNYTTLL